MHILPAAVEVNTVRDYPRYKKSEREALNDSSLRLGTSPHDEIGCLTSIKIIINVIFKLSDF
jgi:hypothetical protein